MKGESDVNDGIKVKVPVGQHGGAYIRGRNGYFEITELVMFQWGEDDPLGDGAVDILGIGKRGKAIRGGFGCLRADEIDALCKAWIEARGGLVILPGEKHATALVTICSGIIDGVLLGRPQDVPALQQLGERYVGLSDPDKWEYHLEPAPLLPEQEDAPHA